MCALALNLGGTAPAPDDPQRRLSSSWTLASLFSTGATTPAPTPIKDKWLNTFESNFPDWDGDASASAFAAKPVTSTAAMQTTVSTKHADGPAPQLSDGALAKVQAQLAAEQAKVAALQKQRSAMASSSQRLENQLQTLEHQQVVPPATGGAPPPQSHMVSK